MTEILDYGLDTPARAMLVLVLSMKDRKKQKAMNKLHYQKIIFYYEKLKQLKEIFFSNFKYGGVSYELAENMESLEESGLVTKIGYKYLLTDKGEKLADELKLSSTYDKDALCKLEYSKELLNDLPDKELLFFMYSTFPETQTHSIEYNQLVKNKKKLTCNLFLKGRINSATAAEWIGINQRKFLEMLPKCD